MALHRPVQLLKRHPKTNKFVLNEAEISVILNEADVRDCNLSIVSISGAFRTGKSFMLSFFLRYLESMYGRLERRNWLGTANLKGFEYKSGPKRHTDGIWIWSKIFTKTLRSGEKIGVILMDTQGTFDNQTTMHDNVTIFTLATLLSSVQIYNISNNIQENNLQNLQIYTEYGKKALENFNSKPFQDLVFLVRDWSWPYDSPYGYAGGENLLNEYMQTDSTSESELFKIRNELKSCFQKIKCFLMPHPGKIVSTSSEFNGNLNDIDPDFVTMTKVFVEDILSKTKIESKKINGRNIQVKNLLKYVKGYLDTFNSETTPQAETIWVATAKINNHLSKDEALEVYKKKMTDLIKGEKYYTFSEMMVKNKRAKTSANKIVSL